MGEKNKKKKNENHKIEIQEQFKVRFPNYSPEV